ncbi:MAG: ROK family protein [Oscillospiraceae bacterium]|nr:ROK family protein [Oscillospiraceae bacterium]
MFTIGIDLGGTNIAAGLVDETGRIVHTQSVKTRSARPMDAIAADIAALAARVAAGGGVSLADVRWIGVGTPGMVNTDTGVVEFCSSLPMLHYPLAETLRAATGRPVHVDNDANAAAYGEYTAGAAKGAADALVITLGTGVGGGFIVGGRIYRGFNFAAAEVGHMVIHAGGRACKCGRSGCMEMYASATGLITTTCEEMGLPPEKVTGRTAFEAMRAGDEGGKRAVNRYLDDLACGVTNFLNILQPEVLCIGGGVSHEGEALLAPLRGRVMAEVYSRHSERNTRIVAAGLGNDAGIIGAAMLGKLS